MFSFGFARFRADPLRCESNVAAVQRLLHGVEADLLVPARAGELRLSVRVAGRFEPPSASRATAPGRSCRRCGGWRAGRAV